MRIEEDQQRDFYTPHLGCATFLRYALGDDAHLSTMKIDQNRILFVFRDEPRGRCRQLADDFFSPESVAVGSALQLLECSRVIKATLAKAERSPEGVWEMQDGI